MNSFDDGNPLADPASGHAGADRVRIPATESSDGTAIDSLPAYAQASRRLIGESVVERQQWNSEVTADAIRHFAWGISDDNPLWIDSDYAATGPYGRRAAPPAFLFSVLYPFLHGAPTLLPLSFLVSGLECRWHLPILEGDILTAVAALKEVLDGSDRAGRETVYIVAETTYRNQAGQIVGTIEGTIAATAGDGSAMVTDRDVHAYSQADLDAVGTALRDERRTGGRPLVGLAIQPGDELPQIVRGPLTLGDLIAWHAAIGPPYRAGSLAYRDLLASPHTAVVMPRVGWPVRYSQQHEDFTLAAQRGMPAPFDNGAMRAAWVSVLLTNWMGDAAFLRRLRVNTVRPVIYGDMNRYAGLVIRKFDGGSETLVTVRLTGTNQVGELTTTGEADIAIPNRPPLPKATGERTRRHVTLRWGHRDEGRATASVCDLFAAQVRTRPDAIAVVADDGLLTYAELDAEADRMSRTLAGCGLAPGSRLGLYFSRTAQMAVAALACAKSGSAYVPLDRAYPTERLARMLDAAAVDWVLTDGAGPGPGSEELGRPVIDILRRNAETCGERDDPSDRTAAMPAGDAVAYVLFTSGSTGSAKAVVVRHEALGLYLRSIIQALDVSAGDVCLHSASFSFSAAVRQFWLPLCIGATLVVAGEESRRRPLLLLETMRRTGTTVWDTVPSLLDSTIEHLRELTQPQQSELLDNRLRRVFTTGEPLKWETIRAWRSLVRNRASVVNLYSQTETAGTVCVYPVPNEDEGQVGIVPLGTPVPGVGICLLDEDLQPVAVGEAGEIGVASERLANGNVGQQEPDAKRFVWVVLPDGTEQCLFRTGDLGRIGATGLLECLGRADDQVKIRGLRVRLGEVEAAIMLDRRVLECVVVAVGEVAPERTTRLLAYVVPKAGSHIDKGEMRAALAAWLPDHALPNAIELVDALPRGAAGKVDRAALPPAGGTQMFAVRASRLRPRNETEELIAGIWREVLGIDELGVDEDFFALGGHSLLASRVVTRLFHQTGIELPLKDFFDNPTIACLAGLHRQAVEDTGFAGQQSVAPVNAGVIPRQRRPE